MAKRKAPARTTRWTKQEQEQLGAECVRIWQEEGLHSRIQCLRKAQLKLIPKERQHLLDKVSAVAWLSAYMGKRLGPVDPKDAARQRADQALQARLNDHIATENELEHALLDQVQARNQPVAPRSPAAATPEPDPWDRLTGADLSLGQHLASLIPVLHEALATFSAQIARAVVAEVTRNVVSEITAAIRQAVASSPEGVMSGNGTKAPTGQRVLIAGLRGVQRTEIEKDFAGSFKLAFWCKDESIDHLRTLASRSDVSIGFVDFLGHNHDQILKTRASVYLRSSGGLTHLREKLSRLADGVAPAELQGVAETRVQ